LAAVSAWADLQGARLERLSVQYLSAKGNYIWRDLQRVCDALGIPFRKPSVFPRNGLLAGRLACLFSEEPWLPEFVRYIFLANFAHDRDISNRTGDTGRATGRC
jgi:2-hydroxychromene-2-carboxylate isomerase